MTMKLGSHLLCLSPKVVKEMIDDLESVGDELGLGDTLEALLATLRGLIDKDPSQWGVQLDWSPVIAEQESARKTYLTYAEERQDRADALRDARFLASADVDQRMADKYRQRAADCEMKIKELKNGM